MADLILPEKLNLDGALGYNEIIKLFFSVFRTDFIDSKPYFKALPVVYDNRFIDSPYPEGFWHVITQGKEGRLIDYKRAKRLPWLKPIIQQANNPDLHTWSETVLDNSAGHPVNKWHIWYEAGNYLVILKERPKRYFLATAFYVTGQREHDWYLKKFEAAQKKGTGG
jgi:hypothetical protein